MNVLDPFRTKLADLRGNRASVREKLERTFERVSATEDEAERDQLRQRVDGLRADVDGLREAERDGDARQLDPRQWMPALDGRIPILLFPLRIQTRFLTDANERTLLVRVFPDDISVQSHDPMLTPTEVDSGKQLWNAPDERGDPAVLTRREIFRGMASQFGLRRAAWIRRATDPAALDAPQVAGALTRFPAVWTLPERLVFRFHGHGGQLMLEVPGGVIPDGLEMGFDPTRGNMGFTRAAGDFEFPPELAWQVDFDAAEKVGMGLRVPLDAVGNGRPIDRIVVLGVRLSTDENASTRLAERLFEDHGYTEGFSLLAQGTPTNVTHDGDALPVPDADATLTWLSGEGAFSDDGTKTLYEDECDGLRLAHALGMRPGTMRYVEGAAQRDASEAIDMKRALWAGTLGYYAQQMLWPMSGAAMRNDMNIGERFVLGARFFFTHFVFGRGPLPAIRVGDQPYGILPVSGDMLTSVADRLPAWNEPFVDDFSSFVHEKLLILSRTWLNSINQLSRAGAGNAADTRLVDVLGLQSGSVEYRAERLIGLEYLENYVDFKKPNAPTFLEYKALLSAREARFASAFPSLFPARPEILNLSFFGAYWKQIVGDVGALDRNLAPLLDGDLVDDLPLSETRAIAEEYPNYLAKFTELDFAGVRRGLTRTKDAKTVPVTALLYMLARHSYLYEHAYAAMRLQHHVHGKPWQGFRENELYNIGYPLDTTYWDTLETPLTWPAFGFGDAQVTTLKLLETREDLKPTLTVLWKTFFGDVDELHRSLKHLAVLPTARLERLFAEHVDLCGYRLDAWITGFTYQRLLAIRAWRDDQRGNRAHPLEAAAQNLGVRRAPTLRYDLNHRPVESYATGLYLGAYGWVEDIEADPTPIPVADLPGDLTPRNGRPVTRDADNYGLIQAPSLNQATTAALLRSASVTEPDNSAFNIDLSSARVRDALWIIDGVRNGQMPAALLGYQFERGLRVRSLSLLQHLPSLRAAFPMPRPEETAPGPTEAIPANNVVNGLRLIQAHRAGTLAASLGFIPLAADRAIVGELAARILNALDACSDLMIAESVHQAALGNYDRAGGVVTAAGEFTHVPDEFEVIKTPRSGTSLTHRVLLAMNDQAPDVEGRTVRARLEPRLNAWIASLLGPLDQLVCGLAYVSTVDGVEQRVRYEVSLDALDLEPIDLLYVLDDTSVTELGERLTLVTRAQFDAENPGVVVDVLEVELLAAGAAGERAVGTLVPLVSQLRKLVGGARAATQRDFVPTNVLHGRSQADIDAVDLAELTTRVESLYVAFEAVMAALSAAGALDEIGLRGVLLDAAQFGVAGAVPVVPLELESLRKQVARVLSAMEARLETARKKWTPPAALRDDGVRVLGEAVSALLGTAFPVMPRVVAVDDLAAAALAVGDPAPERMEDWLFASSLVRENGARLQHARVLASATATDLAPLQAFQWPADHKKWIADAGAIDATQVRDYLAIMVQPDEAFDPAQPFVGLLIDEWQELIPTETETTGISFHYDAPNAEPPQSLLLAVSMRSRANDGNWSWNELVDCIDQSLVLAKMRAVGPDQLRHTELDAVLPATLAAEAATPATIATSFFANISESIATSAHTLWSRT